MLRRVVLLSIASVGVIDFALELFVCPVELQEYLQTSRPGLLPPTKQKVQINPELSFDWMKNGGHVTTIASECQRSRRVRPPQPLDRLILALGPLFSPNFSKPDRVRYPA